MPDDLIGLGFIAALVVLGCLLVLHLRLPHNVQRLICIGVILRVFGAGLYFGTFSWTSYGGGDYSLFVEMGTEHAARIAEGDFSMFTDSTTWWGGKWYGTQFIFYLTSVLVTVIGPSVPGLFVIFALLGFIGLVGFAVAFDRTVRPGLLNSYLAWMCLFPSLWFWPSAVGKDAVLLMGLGLSVWGYVGKNGRISWLLLATGLFFVFAIRPQVAAVVILSIVLGHVITSARQWSVGTVAQSAAVAVLGFWLLQVALGSIGAGGFQTADIEGYVSQRAAATAAAGGTTIATGTGLVGALMGLTNVLFRPFLWEVSNLSSFISAVEIWGFWIFLWLRRQNVATAVRAVTSNRLLAMGAPFMFFYAVTLGMAVANLGIIARQRIYLFPFLLVLLCETRQGIQARTPLRSQFTSSKTRVRAPIGRLTAGRGYL